MTVAATNLVIIFVLEAIRAIQCGLLQRNWNGATLMMQPELVLQTLKWLK